jgi:NAD+ synthase (glutamine-hydrolysing)
MKAGSSSWLWDYLRRAAGHRGYFLPLSGGRDSACVLSMLYVMCIRVCANVRGGCEQVGG